MNKNTFYYIQLISYCFLIILLTIISGKPIEVMKIKHLTSSKSNCADCHKEEKKLKYSKIPLKICDTFCLTCHKDVGVHHKVGIRNKFHNRNKLQLTEKNRIACITCHDISQKRFDSISWRAESLYESIFKNNKQYKTFYLVIRNNNGALCKNCH